MWWHSVDVQAPVQNQVVPSPTKWTYDYTIGGPPQQPAEITGELSEQAASQRQGPRRLALPKEHAVGASSIRRQLARGESGRSETGDGGRRRTLGPTPVASPTSAGAADAGHHPGSLAIPGRPVSAPVLLRGEGLLVRRSHLDSHLQRIEDKAVQRTLEDMRREGFTKKTLEAQKAEDPLCACGVSLADLPLPPAADARRRLRALKAAAAQRSASASGAPGGVRGEMNGPAYWRAAAVAAGVPEAPPKRGRHQTWESLSSADRLKDLKFTLGTDMKRQCNRLEEVWPVHHKGSLGGFPQSRAERDG